MNDDKYRSRKFRITCVLIAVASLALFLDKLSGSEFVTLATFILGIYGAANVGEKWALSNSS